MEINFRSDFHTELQFSTNRTLAKVFETSVGMIQSVSIMCTVMIRKLKL